MAVFIFAIDAFHLFFFLLMTKSLRGRGYFEFSSERYSRKVIGNLISEAEEEEGVLNSKLEWI